ncbi:DUF488 domain-containing protein [Nostocoides veronense]|uniref:Uncharacterized protein n=1 Tax=Nostocoides veronense TaxID=330836 RepID=A0ABN2LT21_9MICO
MAKVSVKRVYDDPADSDGARVLVDRLLPRGVSKERAHLDQWLKAVAPTTEQRTWYSHDPDPPHRQQGRRAQRSSGARPTPELRSLNAEHAAQRDEGVLVMPRR